MGEAILLDGTMRARELHSEIAAGVKALAAGGGPTPHLAAVLIGNDPASETYVAMKARACARVGMASSIHRLPPDCTQADAISLVTSLNDDSAVSGILVQHPLPKHLHEPSVLDAVSPGKDIDGISRASLGVLVNGEPGFAACTPAGMIDLLDRFDVPIEGQRAVIVGRSIILGKPIALMLLNRNATVTVCHTKTTNLAEETLRADILVAAAGKAEMITGRMIKPGAAVLDAGYNRVEGRTGDVGDVEFAGAQNVAGWLTPVPGGVGPMTIAMLMRNTLRAAGGDTVRE